MNRAAAPPRYSLLVFDLDGTLADPGGAITDAIRSTLASFGIEEHDQQRLRSYVGPVLAEVYAGYGLAGGDCEQALVLHEQTMSRLAPLRYRAYAGIPQLLHLLRTRGVELVIATSKYASQAAAIVHGLGLGQFAAICGGCADDRSSDKTRVVRRAIAAVLPQPRERIAVVGDRGYDLDAADRCGVDGIAAAWGFGAAEELRSHPHRFLACSVQELRAFLLPD